MNLFKKKGPIHILVIGEVKELEALAPCSSCFKSASSSLKEPSLYSSTMSF